nr:hypothetical protein [Burkholderia pseudomallei]
MRSTPIDLSQLPAPDIVDPLDFETLFAERKARLVSLYPPEHQAEIAATLALESEPVTRVLQENAYREVLLRQLINDKARGLLLAYARGTTLEHIAALFDVERLVVTAADPEHGIDAVYEDEDSLRERVQLAPRGFSVAGPEECDPRDAALLLRPGSRRGARGSPQAHREVRGGHAAHRHGNHGRRPARGDARRRRAKGAARLARRRRARDARAGAVLHRNRADRRRGGG